MLKRILYFSNPYHLSFKNNQLIISSKDSGETKQAAIEDLGFLVLDNQQITFTQSVMQALAENNTAVVFCNKKHHPSSMLFHLDTNSIQTEIFTYQINANEPLKKNIWKQIIEAKIKNQAALLKNTGKNEKPLLLFASQVKSGDTTNREAQASRYYWQNILNMDVKFDKFTRPLMVGLSITTASLVKCFSGEIKKINYPELKNQI